MAMAAGPFAGAATAGLAASASAGFGETPMAVPARASVAERGLGAVRRSILLGWYFWTLPFRIGCSLALLLFMRVVAQPLDFAQEQVLGFSIVAVERTTNRLVNLIRPLWHRIFPFKDHDVSLALKDPVAAADAQARMQYQPQYQHQQQQQFQQFPFQQGARQQQTAPAFASTRYADERSGDPRQRSQDPFVASPPPLPATRRASDYAEGATSSRGPAGAGVRRRGRAHQASNSSTLSDDLSDDLVSEDDSEVSAKLPPAAVHASAAEIDKAVLLAIEAQQTHVVVEKLFYIAVLLMAIVGVVLFRVDFTRNWSGQKIANVEPAMGFEGIYGILLVLTMAFRSDFPFNLGILMLVVFFAGVVFGTIISRNAFAKPLENQSDE